MATPLTVLLAEESILLDETATDRDAAIRLAGGALATVGAVDEAYVEAMIDRENSVSTFMGERMAMPHGTLAAKDAVRRDALSLVRLPRGVDWDGNEVRLVFGIAAREGGHIALLSRLATAVMDPAVAVALCEASSARQVYALLEAAEQE